MSLEKQMHKVGHVTSVDAARGLLACCVMAFHGLSNESIVSFENVGYYAVYAFFAISGFSLWISYHGKLQTASDIRSYLLKRFFRIAPLYYLALIIRLSLYPLPPTWVLDLPANITLLLGFYNPGASSLITGGWSLGIEFVFYLLLPILLTVAQSLRALATLAAGALIMQILFVNSILGSAEVMTGAVWSSYAQPVSFAGYFLAGCVVGEIYRISPTKYHRHALPVAGAALILFALIQSPYPTGFLTGGRGLVLTTLTIVFVSFVAFLPPVKGTLLKGSVWLGVISYPVYLLHPLVHYSLHKYGVPWAPLRIILVFTLTIAASHYVSKYFEQPARQLGSAIAFRQKQDPRPT